MLGKTPVRVDVARGRQSDAAADRGREIGEDVAEEVVRDDDVESSRIRDQEDGGGVDVQVVDRDLRMLGRDRVDVRFQRPPAKVSTLVLCTRVSFLRRDSACSNA